MDLSKQKPQVHVAHGTYYSVLKNVSLDTYSISNEPGLHETILDPRNYPDNYSGNWIYPGSKNQIQVIM